MLQFISCVFLISLIASFAESQSSLDDPCYMVTSTDPSGSVTQVRDVTIPADCTSGDFDWHYPKGSLHLVIKRSDPNQSFTVCIAESWATMLGGLKDVTDGMDQKLNLPTEGQPSCTVSHTGQAEVLISSESTQYYMTTFMYSISTN